MERGWGWYSATCWVALGNEKIKQMIDQCIIDVGLKTIKK